MSAVDLSFVTDDRLRELLEGYYREARESYQIKCYLGAMVVCGAVLEGLLTWALLQHKDRAITRFKQKYPNNKRAQEKAEHIDKWDLTWLIDVACDLEVLGTTARDASWAVKEFRNFVHPYRIVERSSARPNDNLARASLAGVDQIILSLRGRLKEKGAV